MLICVALIAVLALVVDGGRALSARETALSEAEQAARVGAAQLSVASLHAGLTTFQVATATAAAEQYMAASGHPGSAAVVGTCVVATVRTYDLPLLSSRSSGSTTSRCRHRPPPQSSSGSPCSCRGVRPSIVSIPNRGRHCRQPGCASANGALT